MQELDGSLQRLGSIIDNLGAKLGPVLRNEATGPSTNGVAPPQPSCTLAASIMELAMNAHSAGALLQDLIDRIEL